MSGFEEDDDEVFGDGNAEQDNNDDEDEQGVDDEGVADRMAEDVGEEAALPANELSVYETMTALQPGRIICRLDASEKEMKAAEAAAKAWLEEHDLYVKSFTLNVAESAAVAEAAAKSGAATGGDEEAAGGGGGGGEEEEGEAAAAAGTKKKTTKKQPNTDMRVFNRDVSMRSIPVHELNGHAAETTVKYLRPELPKDTKKVDSFLSPAQVRYKWIIGKELPLHDCVLGSGKATPKEIAAAMQRIGETVLFGNTACLGSIVTFPGYCSAAFESEPVYDVDKLGDMEQFSAPLPSIERAELGSCATVVLLSNTDVAQPPASDFLRVRPIRVTVGAYTAYLAKLVAELSHEVSQDAKNVTKQNRLATLHTLVERVQSLKKQLPKTRGIADADSAVLRLFAYNTIKREFWQSVSTEWFCSVIQTLPSGSKKTATLPPEKLAEKRKDNLRFLHEHENRTFVEITTRLYADGFEPETGECPRWILRVPILPSYVYTHLRNLYKKEWADIVASKGATSNTPGAAAAATAAAALILSTNSTSAATTTPSSTTKPAAKTATPGKVEAQPTKADISSVTTSDATQKQVKKRTAEQAAIGQKAEKEPQASQESATTAAAAATPSGAGDILSMLGTKPAKLGKTKTEDAAAAEKETESVAVSATTTKKSSQPAIAAPSGKKKNEANGAAAPTSEKHQNSAAATAPVAKHEKVTQPSDEKEQFLFDKMCKLAEMFEKKTDKKDTHGEWAELELPLGEKWDDKRKPLLLKAYHVYRACGMHNLLLEQRQRIADAAAAAAEEAKKNSEKSLEQKSKKAKIVEESVPELDDL